jgi:hypothetical protein
MKKFILIPALMLAAGLGYISKQGAAAWTPPIPAQTAGSNPVFGNSVSGSGSTQTFTNSPCTGTTTEQWIPVQIYGTAGGTWYIPACQ